MTAQQLLAADFGSVADLIRAHAEEAPTRPALVEGDRVVDYLALDALMDRVAAALQRDGVGPREAIAVCAATTVDYAALFLGALRAGVAVAPLAPSATPQSLARMAEDADARLLFVDATVEVAATAARRIALDGSAGGEPFERWLAPPAAMPQPVDVRPDWPFNLIYSSGTTGEPKGIVQPYGMRWGHIQRGAPYEYGPETVTLLATPLYSNTTLVAFFPTLAYGGCAVLMQKFDAARYLALAERHRATHTMLVPVQYQRLMARPDFDRYDLSAFRYKFSTSAPLSAAVKADILARWPGNLIETYGMTEGGGTCMLDAKAHPDKLHTVGRPVAGHDLRLIDEEGREVPPGAAGEVVGRSPSMMTGYHKRPDKTAEAEWFDADGRRYIRTGDIGRFDADGFLTLFDRRKDMIISGGFNVYPSDLETVLAQHPAVAEAAVVGVPSAEWGETPVAFAVLREGAAAGGDELRQWANERLGKTQRLAAVHLIDELPRSAIGKVLKRELRERHVRDPAGG